VTRRMEGKKVLVVGAGQPPHEVIGNGRAISLRLASEGAEVCAVDRDADRAAATVDAVVASGGHARAIIADVTRPNDCAALVDAAHTAMGRIDALINVVGGSQGDASPLDLDPEGWQHIMDLNLRGTWLVSRAVVPIMKELGGGAITNISSVGSRASGGRFFAYSVSKAGVNALSHFFAVQYAPFGIRCNVILPSWILTPHAMEGLVRGGVISSADAIQERGRNSVPLGRMGTAWDVANAVLFLSSDEASFITGLEMPVDGGTLAIIGRYQRPAD
jgi:NAD(P)-dependent dehydrogenase (short-subunit alcohol dehydrogenase family)